MKRHFITTKFSEESRRMISLIEGIMDDYNRQGYDLSLRQLYYQLVAGDHIPHERAYVQRGGKWIRGEYGVDGASTNAEPNYNWIGDLVSDGRLAGLLDWNMIKDRGREVTTLPHWENPKEFMRIVAPQYRFNLWDNQPNYVEVMVEKQALEGVLEPVCEQYDVPFTANKGYSSSSALYEAGRRFANAINSGKRCHVIYLGDHDPSGIDMSRDVAQRINLFAGALTEGELTEFADESELNAAIERGSVDGVVTHRIALNMDQIRSLRPPENPAKITDPRASGYIQRFGNKSWELDAIEARKLAKLVSDAIEDLRDEDQYLEDYGKMEDQRKKLLQLASSFDEE